MDLGGVLLWAFKYVYHLQGGMNKKYHVTAIANVHAKIAGNKVMF